MFKSQEVKSQSAGYSWQPIMADTEETHNSRTLVRRHVCRQIDGLYRHQKVTSQMFLFGHYKRNMRVFLLTCQIMRNKIIRSTQDVASAHSTQEVIVDIMKQDFMISKIYLPIAIL